MKTARVVDWSETTSNESDLATRCAAGEPQACQELVDEHQRMVYHLALQLLGNHEDALDLSQRDPRRGSEFFLFFRRLCEDQLAKLDHVEWLF